MNRDKL